MLNTRSEVIGASNVRGVPQLLWTMMPERDSKGGGGQRGVGRQARTGGEGGAAGYQPSCLAPSAVARSTAWERLACGPTRSSFRSARPVEAHNLKAHKSEAIGANVLADSPRLLHGL